MTEDNKPQEDKPEPNPDESQEKTFMPEFLKKPNLRPSGFKYVPPKASKRHF